MNIMLKVPEDALKAFRTGETLVVESVQSPARDGRYLCAGEWTDAIVNKQPMRVCIERIIPIDWGVRVELTARGW